MADKKEQHFRELHYQQHANENTDSEDEFFALAMEKAVEKQIQEEIEEEGVAAEEAETERLIEEQFSVAWDAQHDIEFKRLWDDGEEKGDADTYWKTREFHQKLDRRMDRWIASWEPTWD